MKFACNKCLNLLTESVGCTFCTDFKRNYLSIVEVNSAQAISGLCHESIEILQVQMKKLASFANSKDNREYNTELNRDILTFVKAVVTLTDSARKLKEANAEEPELDFGEKVTLMIEELNSMPIMLRKRAVDKIISQCAVEDSSGGAINKTSYKQ